MEQTARQLMKLHPDLHTWFGVNKLVFAPMGKNGPRALRRAKELLMEKGFRQEHFLEENGEPGFFLERDVDGTKDKKDAFKLAEQLLKIKLQRQ